jgi:mono/diheme cytochrome c family protein
MMVAIAILVLALFAVLPTRTRAVGIAGGDAAATYKGKCAMCHGADGSGNTPLGKKENIRDLRSADVQKQTDDQLLAIILKGKGKMPGYEKSLGADQCKALVAHIRSLKQ